MDLLFSTASTILGSPDSNQSALALSPEPSLAYRRKRRITYEDLGHTVRDLHDNSDPRVTKFIRLLSRNVRSFCLKEFFYSTIDANYYNENEFISCLGMLGLEHVQSMTRYEWSVVKSVMGVEIGRPRRFSAAFLESERIKLKDYRRERRHNKAASSISIGDTVTVCDMKTKTIARGLVISTVEAMGRKKVKGDESDSDYEFKDSYLVQLERPELGIEIYDDVDIAVIQAGIVVRQDVPQPVSPFNFMSLGSLNGIASGPPRAQGQRNGKNSQSKATFTQSTDNSSETADSTPDSSQCMEDNGDDNENTDWGEAGPSLYPPSSRQSSSFGAPRDRDNQSEDIKEESKELILKRCADAVQKVWPDCLAEAERCVEKELDIMIKTRNEIEKAGGSGVQDGNGVQEIRMMSDSRFKDLMVRCIGGLLLLRDTKGKWLPQYAEPVLVAVASGICEGGSVQDYRLMMNNLGVILSNI
jgi:DIRP